MSTPKVLLVVTLVAGGGLAAWIAFARGGPEIPDPVTPDML